MNLEIHITDDTTMIFTVICKTKEDAREILEAIRMMIESLGLELTLKSQIVPFSHGLVLSWIPPLRD